MNKNTYNGVPGPFVVEVESEARYKRLLISMYFQKERTQKDIPREEMWSQLQLI
jgi:hypothetical protein